MKIAVVDGMGGGMGAQIVQGLVKGLGEKAEVWALGTNAMATTSMIKAGAKKGATGENAIKISINEADIIIGPLGIIIPNSMMGEITPFISEEIASSKCRKILIPVNQPHFELVGFKSKPLGELIKETIDIVLA